MDYPGYEHQQEDHQQQQTYGQSQVQAYDQSQAYYGYNQQYDQQYAYYASQDYANSYAQQTHQQFQESADAIHPPGVPISESAHSAVTGNTHVQNHQNAHYLPGVAENQPNLNPGSGYAAEGSINPAAAAAAVAALSQLTQFAGNIDVAQGATQYPIEYLLCSLEILWNYLWTEIGQSQFRGRGSRGGRPFRRGGRGHFRHQGVPFRGRGRGRGGASRQILAHTSAPTNSIVAYPPAADGATSVVQPPSSSPGQITLSTPQQVPAAPAQPPPRRSWCEICKVECNTPEILEQHKNGKRHKKNSLVHEELQRLKAMNGQQSGQMPTSQLNSSVQPENIQELEKKPAENIISEVTTDHMSETELQKDTGETSKVPAEESDGKPGDNISAQGRGSKRKMRGGRGGKNARTNDGARRPVEPPKPKQVVPFICELCNVKCESQVVYDSHLAGKKHLSSLKRVHGLQALPAEARVQVQAQNPPDINALSNSINSQVQQGVNDPQVLLAQLLMNYVMSQAQNPGIVPPLGSSGAPQIPRSTSMTGSGFETLVHGESENPTGETRNQNENVPAGSNTSTQTAIGSSESEGKVVNLAQNNSVVVPAEDPGAANDQLPSTVS